MKPSKRFHQGSDLWGRGSYSIPATALVGSSYCGEWSDSPCKREDFAPEFARFRKEVLKPLGIPSRTRSSQSGNVFMVKVWVCVPADRWAEAVQPTKDWLAAHQHDTRKIHDAELPTTV